MSINRSIHLLRGYLNSQRLQRPGSAELRAWAGSVAPIMPRTVET